MNEEEEEDGEGISINLGNQTVGVEKTTKPKQRQGPGKDLYQV